MLTDLKNHIESAWENGQPYSPSVRECVQHVLQLLDQGEVRVAEKIQSHWQTHAWIKKAILLYFKINSPTLSPNPVAYDKIPLKTEGWTEKEFQEAAFRLVPGAIVRKGSYIGPHTVLMPSFINIGAYIGEGSMIDSWATIGSCAQIGKNCHISSNAGIGGVLEPLSESPVIIEDSCFIGAQSEIAEGVIIQEGSVIAMGVCIGKSTPIIDRLTGETLRGFVPPYSVVVSGTRPSEYGPALSCAVIVKRVDSQTRLKTSINDILHDAS